MLEKLKIKNFKSYVEEEFNLHPNINVFCGIGQSGKTNIIRAIQLLSKNRPNGGVFLHKGVKKKGDVFVEGTFDSGDVVSIKKSVRIDKSGKKKLESTDYKLNKEKPFSGVGMGIPDRIVDVLNMSEVNIQSQLDAPFLITESAGEVARTINRITKLEEVDAVVSSFTSDINSANRDIKKVTESIDGIKSELKIYDDLDETEGVIKSIEALDFEINNKENIMEEIDELLEQIEEYLAEIKAAQPAIEALELLEEAENIQEEINGKEHEIEDIRDYTDQIYQLKLKLGDSDLLFEVELLLEEAAEIDELYVKQEDRLGFLEETLNELKGDQRDLERKTAEYEEAKLVLNNYLVELGVCSECGQKVSKECIEKIMEEL